MDRALDEIVSERHVSTALFQIISQPRSFFVTPSIGRQLTVLQRGGGSRGRRGGRRNDYPRDGVRKVSV